MNIDFVNALINNDKETIKTIPKTDFHNHSLFGTRLSRVKEWVGKSINRPPCLFKNLDEMRFYAHQFLYPYIDSRKGFEFTTEAALKDAIEDGVTILEMSIDTKFIAMYENKEQDVISFLKSLITSYSNQITFRPEIGISRDRNFDEVEELATRCLASDFFLRLISTAMKQQRSLKSIKSCMMKQKTRNEIKSPCRRVWYSRVYSLHHRNIGA